MPLTAEQQFREQLGDMVSTQGVQLARDLLAESRWQARMCYAKGGCNDEKEMSGLMLLTFLAAADMTAFETKALLDALNKGWKK